MRRALLGVIGAMFTVGILAGTVGTGGAGLDTTTSPVEFDTCGSTTWTVPAGVTAVTLVVAGAQGGTGQGDSPSASDPGIGGLGGETTATVAVTPGSVLEINVGCRGQDGSAGSGGAGGSGGSDDDARGGAGAPAGVVEPSASGGGGGGGASDVRLAGSVLVQAGGGGGGGAAGAPNCVGCDGGDGGSGGGAAGTAGIDGAGAPDLCTGGQPGEADAAGAGGLGCGNPPAEGDGLPGNGSIGGDGSSFDVFTGGGGGGGGRFGGGAGGSHDESNGDGAGGGGGGSGFAIASATDVSSATGRQSGDGRITITWVTGVIVAEPRFTG